MADIWMSPEGVPSQSILFVAASVADGSVCTPGAAPTCDGNGNMLACSPATNTWYMSETNSTACGYIVPSTTPLTEVSTETSGGVYQTTQNVNGVTQVLNFVQSPLGIPIIFGVCAVILVGYVAYTEYRKSSGTT